MQRQPLACPPAHPGCVHTAMAVRASCYGTTMKPPRRRVALPPISISRCVYRDHSNTSIHLYNCEHQLHTRRQHPPLRTTRKRASPKHEGKEGASHGVPEDRRADALLPGKTDLEATEHNGTVPGAEGIVVVSHGGGHGVVVRGAAPSSVVVRHGSVGEVACSDGGTVVGRWQCLRGRCCWCCGAMW